MSDEFDTNPDGRFTSFIPLTIVLSGLIVWFGFQDYGLNNQRRIYNAQIQNAMPSYNQAVAYASRYKALLKDLIETAQKDPASAAIVKEAMQAGWIAFQPGANGTNSTASPAEPAPAAPAS